MTELHPLAELRRQGLDADLHQGRVRVWPRHKMTKAQALFVTLHLPDIAQALRVESNEKRINNVFLWDAPAAASGPDAGATIPDFLNGQRFAGVPAYRH
ncbi:hypothetical protein ACQE3D_09685 [Methylomonas sp. MS20]|uniref:hypothetical protein n=1 Tax=unclassified Methylomonas TaxID=2608980 RepID=UPI0028A46343|nr:hypothetical protein [Methylomonas sp. MV1]MDT4328730.1 hypothetical protein [Methylomonas sp. MV1]